MNWFLRLFLTALASLFFNMAHPGHFFEDGAAFFSYISLIPVFILIRRSSVVASSVCGLAYGVLSYGFLFSWIGTYNPTTMLVGCAAFALIFAVLFAVLKAADIFFGDASFYVMALLWCVFEYLKTKGFLGFSYGILGYASWKSPLMIQCASLGGVWILSLLCAFSSAVAASLISDLGRLGKKQAVRKNLIPAGILAFFFCSVIAYGFYSLSRSDGPVKRIPVLCVQNNTDSNKYGLDVYKKDVAALMSLTEKGLSEHPETALVIWPETAVVPPIEMHYADGTDGERYAMIESLLEFICRTEKCFVIGNQRRVPGDGEYSDDYNAALVFDPEMGNVIPPEPLVYAKNHLVPFTEYFPYEKLFPSLYKKLLGNDTHLWTPGTEKTVFTARGVSFAVPICFEDSFGSLCREFVRNGAECFFNMSNDSWSQSRFCQKQHLSMAVFRSVENGVPTARSTASGVSCIIDSRGRITNEAEQFCGEELFGRLEIPIKKRESAYTRFGDWLPGLEAVILAAAFLARILHSAFKKKAGTGKIPVEKKGKKEVE